MRPRTPKRRDPEVIVLAQGQARRVAAELLDIAIEEDSTVRPAWPGKAAIAELFRDAQRLRA